MQSLVSIVIPCYGGENFFEESLQSCMEQSYGNFEIIVVDDASPDRCREIAEKYAAKDAKIRVIKHQQNRGAAAAFNTGFNSASGEFFTRLAQDDVFKPEALQKMVTVLGQNPGVDMVYADMEYINEHGTVAGQFRTTPTDEALHGHNGIGLCWMFRRAVWEREPEGFDSEFDQIEDFEFWMRAAKHSRIMRLEDSPLLQFRQHDQSGTSQHAARMELLTAKVLARHATTPNEARKALATGAFNASWIYRSQGKWADARREAFRALRLNPFSIKNQKNLLSSFLKVRGHV